MSERKIESFKAQRLLVAVAVGLFLMKLAAFFLTNSVAILTDALESTANVVAGFIGLYSLYLSAQPRDENHPYGHGKVEFLSAAVEGALVLAAGAIIIYEAILNLRNPHELQRLDAGIWLVAATAAINYGVGEYCVRTGRRTGSLALIASGSHMKTDTWTTAGLIAGLLLMRFTGLRWLDSAVAIFFALIIVWTGFSILKSSISGIMDEVSEGFIERIAAVLTAARRVNWIDVHHVRALDYAGFYHIDCHLTVPRFFTVEQGHDEVELLTKVLKAHFSGEAELSIHADPCFAAQCSLCEQPNCPVRSSDFKKRIEWTAENLWQNQKHSLAALDAQTRRVSSR